MTYQHISVKVLQILQTNSFIKICENNDQGTDVNLTNVELTFRQTKLHVLSFS